MLSGVVIEMYGVVRTFRYSALAGTVVLVILLMSQIIASFLEQKDKRKQEYRIISDSEK